jgi:hypothetical protein
VGTVVQGDFEWDDAKAAANFVKHGVTFEEAATAVTDPDAIFLADDLHAERFCGDRRVGQGAHPLRCAGRSRTTRSHHQCPAGHGHRANSLHTKVKDMTNRMSKMTRDANPEEVDISRTKVVGRGLKKDRRLTLQTLRVALGKTQADVARAAEMEQGDVSRLEARDDMKLSTLTRYAAAIGGRVEVAIVIGGRRYMLEV